jgi:integrase
MARRKYLTNKQVADLKPEEKRFTDPDPELLGHYVRVTPRGNKSYCAVARNPDGKQVWATIGSTDHHLIEDAREIAREAIKRIKNGLAPFPPLEIRPDSFKAVAENYLKLHVEANKLRSQSEIERILEKYLYPILGDTDFEGIKNTDVSTLRDDITATNGKWEADHAFAILRGIMNWYAARSDDYVTPIKRGYKSFKQKDRARNRFLSREEIRLVWKAAGSIGVYGSMVRFAFLTAQRKGKIEEMQWDHLDGEIWHIPREEDYDAKGHPSKLKLPQLALDVLAKQKRIEGNPYVFTGRTSGYFNGNSKAKVRLDNKVATLLKEKAQVEPIKPWRFHDLRRTASTLMNEAGVRPDIVERVLGHAIEGVAGIYNRAEYEENITEAIEVLANQIEIILNPPADNVVPINEAGQ